MEDFTWRGQTLTWSPTGWERDHGIDFPRWTCRLGPDANIFVKVVRNDDGCYWAEIGGVASGIGTPPYATPQVALDGALKRYRLDQERCIRNAQWALGQLAEVGGGDGDGYGSGRA